VILWVIAINNKVAPAISIIMPAFNAEKTISQSIESVISQTYKDWELIIINDNSSDKTAQIIKEAADNDNRIRYLTHEYNKGVAEARNAGIKIAQGERIAFLDSDDLWTADKLEKQLSLIKEKNAIISYTATSYINEAGKKSGYILQASPRLTYRQLLKRNIMSCSSVIVQRDAMLRHPFPKGDMHEDYAVWLSILREADHAYGHNEPLLIYRISAGSKSHNRLRSARMLLASYKHIGYGRVAAFLLTVRYLFHSVSKRLNIRIR